METEEYLEKIISMAPGHLYWLDVNNIYLGCNERQAISFGLNNREDIKGKTNFDLFSDKKIAEQIDEINLRVMKDGVPYVIEESAIWDEKERIYLSEKVPLYNRQGEIIGLLGVSVDITERKQMEKELKEAKAIAETANLVKDEFIRNMEHDIRTPIAGLIGINNYLKEIEVDPEKIELLSDMEMASQEIMNYYTDILEFTHIERGSIPITISKFNLKNLVNSVWKMELPAAKNKKLDFTVDYAENVPTVLVSDKFRIQRILINLVSNAIKFTQSGYVKIKLEVAEIKGNNIDIFIIVKDSGIGISEKHQTLLFEKFNRAESSNKGNQKGTGLGLRIVKQFINELRGEIIVNSSLKLGSQFICKINFDMNLNQN